jgi:hypothetical protein
VLVLLLYNNFIFVHRFQSFLLFLIFFLRASINNVSPLLSAYSRKELESRDVIHLSEKYKKKDGRGGPHARGPTVVRENRLLLVVLNVGRTNFFFFFSSLLFFAAPLGVGG